MINPTDTFLYRRINPISKQASNGRASVEQLVDLVEKTIGVDKGVPDGGSSGQVLTKNSDGTYSWQNPISVSLNGIPSGGTTGQVLTKNSNADYDATWVNDAGTGTAIMDATTVTPNADDFIPLIVDGSTTATPGKVEATYFASAAALSSGLATKQDTITLSASQLFGRGATGGVGAITLGTNLSMSGTTLNATGGGGAQSVQYKDFGLTITATAGTNSLWSNGQVGVNYGVGGTASAVASDTTSFGKWPRIRYATAATAGSFMNMRTAGNGANVSLTSGFDFDCIIGHSDAATVADSRSFYGVRGVVGDIGNNNPSTLINIIGVGNDSGDANLQVIYNDGTGTATKIDLGANFPANTNSTDIYRIQLAAVPGATSVTYTVTRLNTGQTATGSVTTDIPSLTTMLGFALFKGNGATALAVRYDFVYMTLTPRSML